MAIVLFVLALVLCATLLCPTNGMRGQQRFLRRAVQTFELSHVMREGMPIWPNPSFRYKQNIVLRQEIDVPPGPDRPPKIWYTFLDSLFSMLLISYQVLLKLNTLQSVYRTDNSSFNGKKLM